MNQNQKKNNKRKSIFKIICVIAIFAGLSFLYWWFFARESTNSLFGGNSDSLIKPISNIGNGIMTGGGSAKKIRLPRQYLNLNQLNSTIKKFNSLLHSK